MTHRVFFSLLPFAVSQVLSLVPEPSRAQIPSWPPGGTARSAMSDTLDLPGGRYLPSSRRYNLVWSDQIVPAWVTPGKVAFAAANYVATQKVWSDDADRFRAHNPNFLVVAYHLAAGLNPPRNEDCPNPKTNSGSGHIGVVAPAGWVAEWPTYFLPWLSAKGILEGGTRFEVMFQHYDAVDPAHRVWHNDPYWLMNLQNADWREYMADTCIEWMAGNANEGCFLDVSVETYVSLYNPKASNPAPGNFNWWLDPHAPAGEEPRDIQGIADWVNDVYLDYYQALYPRFHGEVDYLVLPNVDQMVTTIYDPDWLDGSADGETVDGAMMEGFGSHTGFDMWQTLDRCVRHLTGRGKILIAQFTTDDPAERYRRTAMYMLVKNHNSYINILDSGNYYDVRWYPEYEIDLGNQVSLPETLDALRESGSSWRSLWKREYANGVVLCNTSDESAEYELEGDGWARLETSGGGPVSDAGVPQARSIVEVPVSGTVTLLPSSALILKKENARPSRSFNFSDFLDFVGAFGTRIGDARFDARFDLDEDGAVRFSDFLVFVRYFGTKPAAAVTVSVDSPVPSGRSSLWPLSA